MTANTLNLTKTVQNYDVEYDVIPLGALTASAADTYDLTDANGKGIIRNGRQILDIKVYAEGTASATVSLGDATDTSRFISAASTASTGFVTTNVNLTFDGSGNITKGLGYRYTADTALRLTIGGASVSAKNYVVYIISRKTF